MTQPTLDDIKRSIEHDAGCLAHEWRGDPECNCTRREKIALLERLQEPTQRMVAAYMSEPTHVQAAGHDPEPREPIDIFFGQWRAVLKAAEEAK